MISDVPPVVINGTRLCRGTRVRLRPSRRADIFDLALAGRIAEVAAVQEDMDGRVHVVVTLEGDVGRDFETGLGHRFYFAPEELEPVAETGSRAPARPRILVAGIGNVFLADDGFGPEVITALRDRPLPGGVEIADFGIRGMDLAYRLGNGYDVALLIDAAPRGGPPGSLYVLEPEPAPAGPDTPAPGNPGGREPVDLPDLHAMDPVRVLRLARSLGSEQDLPRVLVLGCEPQVRMTGEEPDVVVGLSPPVRAAVTEALPLLDDLLANLLRDPVGGR
ncbi:hydrogenase maturation protease [Streptomyces sp. ACA25]|uniref:hydrogenase maturation protease n=1 Tax=Streptomyces sp. ACA25 TaxID=3022596 RepID=UPI0023082531|nr:hydrogenase maturation protease [Streptomyces sp. ACA25]MDB1088530.1 hydrogenase maturation protease [Streptomyces sp. ACA25]